MRDPAVVHLVLPQYTENAVISITLRRAREKLGKQQKDVAADMGITKSYLCELEQGRRNWSRDLVERYVKVCGIKLAS